MDTIKQIHNDFDTAVETLLKISAKNKKLADSLNEPTPDGDYEDGEWLAKIGFTSIDLAKKVKNFESDKSEVRKIKQEKTKESENITKTVEIFNKYFPFHKFILYSQVINICEKYNLYLGHASLYNGSIPKKNIEEIKNFPFNIYNDINFRCKPKINKSQPVCEYDNNVYIETDERIINTYICAPLINFNQKDTLTIGKELYYKNSEKRSLNIFKFKPKLHLQPKDPIILLPVIANAMQQIGFIVITKWGLEANDKRLIVPKNN